MSRGLIFDFSPIPPPPPSFPSLWLWLSSRPTALEHLLDEARSFSSGPYEENNACVFFLRGLAAAPTGARALQ